MRGAPKELALPPEAIDRADANEVLRAFVVDNRLAVAFLRAFEEPDMWGMMLVDIARHAARAFAKEGVCSEDEALARIVNMFEAELARPTDAGTTTAKPRQAN
jgi:hypothetical protein